VIEYPTGGATIDAEGRARLSELIAFARGFETLVRIRVEGHDDTCGPVTGMMPGQERAYTARQELIDLGVDPGRIVAAGYGSTQPRAAPACGPGEVDRNRRVEFSVLVCWMPDSTR